MNRVGLYIHIPFCKSRCRYCDFCSLPHPKSDTVDAYIRALVSEMAEGSRGLAAHFETAPLVDTVFFGGGTPTILSLDHWEAIFKGLARHFSVSPDAEITAECNPATADLGYFKALKAFGINRLSIGAQSMNDRELKLLGRLHKSVDVVRTFWDARSAGFGNISLDLMFGIPEGTPKSLAETIRAVLALAPEHISLYGLQVEEGTYFGRHKDALALPDEDTERQMYYHTVATLADHGYGRYEISNLCRPGFESRHNLKYWQRGDYLGLGLAAHSCLGARRFANTEDMAAYLVGQREATSERISPHDMLCEAIMLGMRLEAGIDLSHMARVYSGDAEKYLDALRPFASRGLVNINGSRVAFSDDGRYISNTILAEVLDFGSEN